MDRIQKALKKLTGKERKRVEELIQCLIRGDIARLDIKRLKGRNDVFRIRTGDIRILYRQEDKKFFLLAVERRREDTYK